MGEAMRQVKQSDLVITYETRGGRDLTAQDREFIQWFKTNDPMLWRADGVRGMRLRAVSRKTGLRVTIEVADE